MKKHDLFLKFMGMVFVILLFLSGTGCVTKSAFKGKADLCGMVVDENNCPLQDFVISYKRGMEVKTVNTNSSGIFVVNDVQCGEFYLKGEKSGYVRIDEKKNDFNDRTRLLCFQVSSIDVVLGRIEALIKNCQYKEALEMLLTVSTANNSNEDKVFMAYKDFLQEKLEK